LEIKDVWVRTELVVFKHELDEILVREHFQMLEGLILLVDLVE
jgi:hypothetical protein